MKIIKVTDRLPKNNTYVLIHLTKTNWLSGDDPKGVYWKVAKFVKGISKVERATMPISEMYDGYARKKVYLASDEHDNNLVAYNWEEFGPTSFFGQEVDYWVELPKIPSGGINI